MLWILLLGGAAVSPARPAQDQTAPNIGVLSFRLVRQGITPASVSVPPGIYRLVLTNEFVRADLTIQLNDPSSQVLSSKKMHRATYRTEDTVQLAKPGIHKITIAENPAWAATVLVEAK